MRMRPLIPCCAAIAKPCFRRAPVEKSHPKIHNSKLKRFITGSLPAIFISPILCCSSLRLLEQRSHPHGWRGWLLFLAPPFFVASGAFPGAAGAGAAGTSTLAVTAPFLQASSSSFMGSLRSQLYMSNGLNIGMRIQPWVWISILIRANM